MGYYVITNSGKKLESDDLPTARCYARYSLYNADFKTTKWPVFNENGKEVGMLYEERGSAPIWCQPGKPARLVDPVAGTTTSSKYVVYFGTRISKNYNYSYFSADDLNVLRKKLISKTSHGPCFVEFLGETKMKEIGRLFKSERFWYWESAKGNVRRVDPKTGALRRD